MQPRFVDTNIFIRFLTKDDPVKAENCLGLFKKVERKETLLTTSESVLSEVVFILSSKKLYALSPKRIYELLLPLIKLPNLKIPAKRVFLNALAIYAETKVDFEDALTAAYMRVKELQEIYSYDKDFDKFTDIKRIEPNKA